MPSMLLSAEQVKAFESPVRATIITLLRAHRAMTAKELSEILGMKSDALYYHLKKLEALGIARVKEVRPGDTRPSAVYELTAPEFYMKDVVEADGEYRESLRRTAENMMRLAIRRYRAGIEQGQPGESRFSLASARLSPENAAKFKQELRDLLIRFMATNDAEGEPMLFTSLLVAARPGPEEDLEG